MFNLRQGGLAIYGGVIAAIITVFVFSRVRKLSMGLLCDTAGLGLVLGQVIGRWGNFFNREAFGGYTDGLFAMQLPLSAVRSSDVTDSLLQHVVEVNGISYIQVHPTFLYESLWNLILLILLILFTRHKRFDGEVFLLYLAGYGIGRFWIESLRTGLVLLPVIGYPVSMALAALLCGRIGFLDQSSVDMLLYAFVKEEKVERALVNVDAAMVDGPMRGVLQKAIDHMHMTFDETDVMRDSLQMIEREYACSRIKNVHDFIVHVEIYGGAIERPVELLLADKKRWEQRICGSMKERRKMFVDIVMSIAASLLICGMILYLPVMEIDISKNLISQVLTIIVVILDDLIFARAQKYLAIDWLALDGHTDEADAKKIEEYYRYDERKEKRLSVVLAVVTAAGAAAAYYFGYQLMTAAALLLVALMANQHRVGRAVARKTLVRSIKCAFPGWLMDIVAIRN